MKYKVLWSNEHASDVFPYVFPNKHEAERFARAWKRDMVALEGFEHRADARAAYEWELIPQQPGTVDPDVAAFEDEQSLDYFNHYIAGDRK
jgi:hypothetical protein